MASLHFMQKQSSWEQLRPKRTMGKLFILFLNLLIIVHGAANKIEYQKYSILEELESLRVEEENEVEDANVPSWSSQYGGKVLVNVDSFGAAGDGISDDTQAFEKAWDMACATPKAVFLVPPGRRYLVNATRFKGPCSDKLVIQIDGTIVAPDEPSHWDPKSARLWLDFYKLNGVLFQGNGIIDGSGSKWWAASCKKNKTNPCRGAPTALTIDSSSSIKVKGLTIQNSQQMHFVISRSDSVRVSEVLVSAPGDSPNTDGIHITESTDVVLQDCKIGTGKAPKWSSLAFLLWSRYRNPLTLPELTFRSCPFPEPLKTSAVKISEIMYRNISGTTKSEEAMKFACSDTVPCSNIVLSNINLESKDGTVETYCHSAEGFGYGIVHPSADCLSSHDKDLISIGWAQETVTDRPIGEDIVHTEL
ncbi:polygalacturonase isoform X2 [Rhodamnia argentea]|uniref:Polygalacturonase isoform X2 n=1 Tax=Rhodamnia argentea TaxID=178133 RepID=A0A8B8QCZ5_9MYRT|nr:polygalacturonase isoform X2 [Rhodamnia argentea]